jgi:hypothetical protein
MDRINRLVDLQAAALAKVAIEIDTLAKAEIEMAELEMFSTLHSHHSTRAKAFCEAKQVITNAIIEVTREAAK